jgi:hypothetical protein
MKQSAKYIKNCNELRMNKHSLFNKTASRAGAAAWFISVITYIIMWKENAL